MDFLNTHLLSLILFLPTIAALIMLFLPSGETKLLRWFAFSASLIPFVLTLVAWTNFDPNATGFQFEEKYVWYEAINSSFHLGVDGISLSMVLLTTLLTPLAILASFSITDRVKPYMMLFLFLETGMLGVFMALDLLIFFVFWEIGLVPMYFLINQWGSANRDYASLKFMIYTMGGSLGCCSRCKCSAFFSGPMTWLPSTNNGIRCQLDTILLGMSVAYGQDDCLLGVCDCVRGQSSAVALPHLAARRAYRSSHCWLDDPGGRSAETWRVRFHPPCASALSGEAKIFAGALAFLAVGAIVFGAFRLLRSNGLQTPGRILVCEPHGLCCARHCRGWTCRRTADAHIAMSGAVLQMFNHGCRRLACSSSSA
jgi:NADH-quinone oxidoreductase subunit M